MKTLQSLSCVLAAGLVISTAAWAQSNPAVDKKGALAKEMGNDNTGGGKKGAVMMHDHKDKGGGDKKGMLTKDMSNDNTGGKKGALTTRMGGDNTGADKSGGGGTNVGRLSSNDNGGGKGGNDNGGGKGGGKNGNMVMKKDALQVDKLNQATQLERANQMKQGAGTRP